MQGSKVQLMETTEELFFVIENLDLSSVRTTMVESFRSLRKIFWHSALLDDRRNSYHRAKAPSYAKKDCFIFPFFSWRP